MSKLTEKFTTRKIKNWDANMKSAFKVLRKKGYSVSKTPVGDNSKRGHELCHSPLHVFVMSDRPFSYCGDNAHYVNLSWGNYENDATEIVEVLREAGLSVSWDGTHGGCIEVLDHEIVSKEEISLEFELEDTFKEMQALDRRIEEAKKRKAELTEKYIQLGRRLETLYD